MLAGACARAILIILALGTVACSPQYSRQPTRDDEGVARQTGIGRLDSLGAIEDFVSAADSIHAVDEILQTITTDMGTNGGVEILPGRAPSSRRSRQPRPLRIAWIFGRRTEVKAGLTLGRTLRVGFRSDGVSALGFVQANDLGFVRSVIAGNLTVRMGERLLFGRGFHSYPSITAGPVRDGVALAPSLSRWLGHPGLAIATGAGNWHIRAVLVGDRPTRTRHGMTWLSVARRVRYNHVGLVVGRPFQWRPSAEASGRAQLGVAAVHVLRRVGVFEGSGEYVHDPRGSSFFAITVAQRDSERWSIRYFKAPSFSQATSPVLHPLPTGPVVRGATGNFRRRFRDAVVHGTVSFGSRHTTLDRRSFRRVVLSLTGRKGDIDWEGSFSVREQSRTRFPTPSLLDGAETQGARVGRLRALLRTSGKHRLTHAVRIDYTPGRRWPSEGLLIAAVTRLRFNRLDLQFNASAYAYGTGQVGYVTRPGIGRFEWLSTVSGRGSDVSMRLRLRLARGVSLAVYYGEPWLAGYRLYAGAELGLP